MSIFKHPGATAEELQNLVIDSRDVDVFLTDLARYSAGVLSDDLQVQCGVTLQRHHKTATIAYSSDEAKVLDEIQLGYDEGPCLEALRTNQTVLVKDARTDARWPEYFGAVAKHGYYSMLGVPMHLEGESAAALDFYAPAADAFDGRAVAAAQEYAAQASKALLLAVRVATHMEASDDLKAAMQARTTIDLAVGILMAQNRCSQQEAFGILSCASNNQNIKLRDLAAKVIGQVSADPVETHFD
jgi:GAF domain-containing protein